MLLVWLPEQLTGWKYVHTFSETVTVGAYYKKPKALK